MLSQVYCGWWSLAKASAVSSEYAKQGWIVVAGISAGVGLGWSTNNVWIDKFLKVTADAKGGIYLQGDDAGFVGRIEIGDVDAGKTSVGSVKPPPIAGKLPSIPGVDASAFLTFSWDGKKAWEDADDAFSITIMGNTGKLLWANNSLVGFGYERSLTPGPIFEVKSEFLSLFPTKDQVGVMRDPRKWWIDDKGHIRPPEQPMFQNDTMRNVGGVRQFEEQKHRTEQSEDKRRQEEWFRKNMPALYRHSAAKFD
jgi:hypothetical protein